MENTQHTFEETCEICFTKFELKGFPPKNGKKDRYFCTQVCYDKYCQESSEYKIH